MTTIYPWKRARVWLLAVASLGLLLVSGCGRPADKEAVLKVGVLAPLTGPFAANGAAMVQSLEMAATDINQRGGVLGRQIVLVTADTQGKADSARAEALNLMDRERVWALIGAYLSEETFAIEEVAADRRKLLIVPIAATNELTARVGSDYPRYKYVFRVAYNIDQWSRLLGDYLASRGVKNYAFVGTNIRWNKELAGTLQDYLASRGIGNVYTDYYSPQNPVMDSLILALKAKKPELVVVGDPGRNSVEFVKKAQDLGLEVPLLSVGGALGDARVASTLNPRGGLYFQGVTWRGHTPEATRYFEKFNRQYKYLPAGYGDTLPYDALQVLAQAAGKAGTLEADKVVQALETGAFEGIAGVYRFDATHQATWGSQGSLPGVVVRWKDGKDEVVWPVKP